MKWRLSTWNPVDRHAPWRYVLRGWLDTRRFFRLAVLLHFSLSFVSLACGDAATTAATRTPTTPPAPTLTPRATTFPTVEGQCGPPARTAVPVDFSDSIPAFGLSKPTAADLKPLIDLTARCGGEFALAYIEGQSARHALLRFRAERPEQGHPVLATLGNVYSQAREQRRYDAALAEWEAKEDARRLNADAEASIFLDSLAVALAREATSPGTNIWGSIVKANTFLIEDVPLAHNAIRQMIAVSDGRHNTGDAFRPIDPRIHAVVVNGSGDLGELARLNPTVLESTPSAVEHAIDFYHNNGGQ